MNEKMKIMSIRAFQDNIFLTGSTYYDSHSRFFNMIRLPAMVKHLFPLMKKKKLRFHLHCFPTMEKLREFVQEKEHPPMLLEFSDVEGEQQN
jgi:hypothetical protein